MIVIIKFAGQSLAAYSLLVTYKISAYQFILSMNYVAELIFMNTTSLFHCVMNKNSAGNHHDRYPSLYISRLEIPRFPIIVDIWVSQATACDSPVRGAN